MRKGPICSFTSALSDGRRLECQFTRLNPKIINSHGTIYCPLHLRHDVEDEHGEHKYNWPSEKLESFVALCDEHLISAIREDGVANFCGVHFPSQFDLADFLKKHDSIPELDFTESVWLSGPSVRNITFEKSIDFTKSKFFEEAKFLSCKFCGVANFSRSYFRKGSVFTYSTFKDHALFEYAELNSLHRFVGCYFIGEVYFSKAKIEHLRMGSAKFDSDVTFVFASKLKSIDAKFARFGKNVNFRIISNFTTLDFSGGQFLGDADFSFPSQEATESLNNTFALTDFSSTTFKGRAVFVNRKFEEPTNFKGTSFHVAPEFYGSQLHQDTNFENSLPEKFFDLGNADERVSAVRAYRTLKHSMEEVRDRQQQQEFFKLEQKALRASGYLPSHVAWTSRAYEAVSDYGQSFLLPAIHILATTFVFFLVFSGFYFSDVLHHQSEYISFLVHGTPYEQLHASPISSLEHAFRFTLEQTFRPFSAFARNSSLPIGVALLGALQSTTILGLLALVLLGLRNRFRLN